VARWHLPVRRNHEDRAQAWPRMRSWTALLLALPLLAGCLADDGDGEDASPDGFAKETGPDGAILHANVARNIGEPIVIEHDHNDALLHTGSHNIELVGYSSLGVTLGDNGFANFALHEEEDGTLLAFVASDGDDRAGLVIADVTDPTAMKPLGSWWMDGNNVQEVRVTRRPQRAGHPRAGLLRDAGRRGGLRCVHLRLRRARPRQPGGRVRAPR
jgi:hypothetical protein